MKVGDNIKEIREVEKNFKRSYMAEQLKITTRAYGNIENNITALTLDRLDEISAIFECHPLYIINYKQAKKEFYNYFHNHNGNQGVNIMNQNVPNQGIGVIQRLLEQLLESERKRIVFLEALLRKNNIEF